jgi:hypothetical protein
VAITTLDGLVNALANDCSRVVIDKASISNAVANTVYSLWRATGQPGQGAIPTTAAICDKTLLGSMQWSNQTSPRSSYWGWGVIQCANSAVTMEVHDRVAHMGGLVLNSLLGQTVNLDLTAAGLNPAAARIGDANFSDVMWWLEVYTDGGATASNATVNVTYNDTTSGNLTVFAVGGTLRAGRMIPLNGLIPAADSGKYIADINTVTLSASTTVAGNFGFTATRQRGMMPLNVANRPDSFDWAALGLPEIVNDSCLFLIQNAVTTTTGTVRGNLKLAHG